MDDIYENIEEYNLNRKRKIFIVSNDMIADLLSNEKLSPIVTELIIRLRKVNISLVFSTRLFFCCAKNIRLNSTHYIILQIWDKQELQQTTFNHSSDIGFKGFMNLYKKNYRNIK